MPVESITCEKCGSAEVTELKAGVYECSHCEAVFKYFAPGSSRGTCFCGIEAARICLGPCARQICEQHAILENNLRGYVKPDDPILNEPFAHCELIAQYGYGTLPGARCPDCRNANAVEALGALPRAWPDDPVERVLYEYRHYGAARGLCPDEQWGLSFALALKRRGIPFGRFVMGEGWVTASPIVIDGHAVWQFARREAGQVNSMSTSSGGVGVLLTMDADGMSPVDQSRLIKQRLKRDRWTHDYSWGPAPWRGSWLIMESLLDRDDLDDQGVVERIGEAENWFGRGLGWQGLPPAKIYEWAIDAGQRQHDERLARMERR